MTIFNRRALSAAGLALVVCGAAAAQESLDSGKTPAELYAADCGICHKSPQGLARAGGGIAGLQAFLRVHYTASREAAATIAAYLEGLDRGAPAPARARKRVAKPNEKSGPDAAKPAVSAKPDGAKSDNAKSDNAKSAEPAQPKPTAPAEAVGKEDKPVEAKADAEKAAPKTPRAVAKPDPEKKSD
jgi:hypothetical protein